MPAGADEAPQPSADPRRSPNAEPIILRCFAYRGRGGYYAECVDLDILVWRETLQEAIEDLNEAIEGHVSTAAAHGWLPAMLKRPSPWTHRARYHWEIAQRAIWSGLNRTVAIFDRTAWLRDGQLRYA